MFVDVTQNVAGTHPIVFMGLWQRRKVKRSFSQLISTIMNIFWLLNFFRSFPFTWTMPFIWIEWTIIDTQLWSFFATTKLLFYVVFVWFYERFISLFELKCAFSSYTRHDPTRCVSLVRPRFNRNNKILLFNFFSFFSFCFCFFSFCSFRLRWSIVGPALYRIDLIVSIDDERVGYAQPGVPFPSIIVWTLGIRLAFFPISFCRFAISVFFSSFNIFRS